MEYLKSLIQHAWTNSEIYIIFRLNSTMSKDNSQIITKYKWSCPIQNNIKWFAYPTLRMDCWSSHYHLQKDITNIVRNRDVLKYLVLKSNKVIKIFVELLGNMLEVNLRFLVDIVKHSVNKYRNNYIFILIEFMTKYGMPMIRFDFINIIFLKYLFFIFYF